MVLTKKIRMNSHGLDGFQKKSGLKLEFYACLCHCQCLYLCLRLFNASVFVFEYGWGLGEGEGTICPTIGDKLAGSAPLCPTVWHCVTVSHQPHCVPLVLLAISRQDLATGYSILRLNFLLCGWSFDITIWVRYQSDATKPFREFHLFRWMIWSMICVVGSRNPRLTDKLLTLRKNKSLSMTGAEKAEGAIFFCKY